MKSGAEAAARRAFSRCSIRRAARDAGRAVEHPRYLCEACAAGAVRIEAPFCQVCSEPFRGAMSGAVYVRELRGPGVSLYLRGGAVPERGGGAGFHPSVQVLQGVPVAASAGGLGGGGARGRPHPGDGRGCPGAGAIVPRAGAAPGVQPGGGTRAAGREAGGDPGFRLPARTRNTTSQVTHDRKMRMENLRNAFGMRHSRDVRGRHLVLVDDVLTTGSTLDECAVCC